MKKFISVFVKVFVDKQVKNGVVMPRYHGFAYRNYYEETRVTAIVPLNLLIAFVVYFWGLIRFGHVEIMTDPRLAYRQGFLDGRKTKVGSDDEEKY